VAAGVSRKLINDYGDTRKHTSGLFDERLCRYALAARLEPVVNQENAIRDRDRVALKAKIRLDAARLRC